MYSIHLNIVVIGLENNRVRNIKPSGLNSAAPRDVRLELLSVQGEFLFPSQAWFWPVIVTPSVWEREGCGTFALGP